MRLLNSSWIQRPLLAAVLGAVSACGGGQTSVAKVEMKDFDAARYLLDYAESSTAILKPETDSLDALGDELRVTRTGTARRDLERRVAAGKLKEAMAAPTPKEARLLRNEANKLLRQSKKGERDSFHLAESEFLELWSAWLGGADDTERMATAYTENRQDALELYTLAWAIRGEAAYAHKRWSPAEEAFRFLVGQVEHPLYAYGLYRTAAVHNAHGEPKEAKAAYTEASEMGCRRGVSAATQEAALFAAQALDIAGRQDPDGVVRPASCPVGGREPPKSLDDI